MATQNAPAAANPAPPATPSPRNGAHYTRINPKDSAQLAAILDHKFKPVQAEAITKHISFLPNDVEYIAEVLEDGEHVFVRCLSRKEEAPFLVPLKSLYVDGARNWKGWKVVHSRVRTIAALGQLNSASTQKFKRRVEILLKAIRNNESQIPNLRGGYKVLVGLAGYGPPPQL